MWPQPGTGRAFYPPAQLAEGGLFALPMSNWWEMHQPWGFQNQGNPKGKETERLSWAEDGEEVREEKGIAQRRDGDKTCAKETKQKKMGGENVWMEPGGETGRGRAGTGEM